MDVEVIRDAATWDRVLTSMAYPPFTQLWAWGSVQEALGKRVMRLAIQMEQGPIMAQWVQERRGPFEYWFAPQGPVLARGISVEQLNEFIAACEKILEVNWRTVFLRVEPRWRQSSDVISIGQPFLLHGAKRVKSMNPSTSFVVPLNGSTEQVFETFHKKTRYNIRLAEKHLVIVRGATEDDLPIFLRLTQDTAKRDGFKPHSESYFRTLYRILDASGQGRLRIAERLGKPLAANFEVLCGDTVMYLFGASSSEEREQMAPYALQWSAIFAATQEGKRWYDFGGGNPVDSKSFDFSPTWEGITRFKERWGTLRVADAGTWDIAKQNLLYKGLVRR